MASDQPPPRDAGAENFLRVLGLIDRTVLPRRLVLSNGGSGELVLLAARQCAALEGGASAVDGGSAEDVAAVIARFCASADGITHHVEPLAQAPAGYGVAAIVNAQPWAGPDAREGAGRRFRFSAQGWPLAAPSGATFTALEAASRMARAMAGWRSRRKGLLDGPALLVAVSEDLGEEVSIAIDGGLALTAAAPAQLGRIVSRWRNRPSESMDDGPAD